MVGEHLLVESDGIARVRTPPRTLGLVPGHEPGRERLAQGMADGGLAIWNLPRIQAELDRIGLACRRIAVHRSLRSRHLLWPGRLVSRTFE